ncbi:MAG: ATP-binding cassette domain-containing protein [Slackia sp.]
MAYVAHGLRRSKQNERTKPMITCTNVEFTYDGDRLVLAGINTHIAPGEFVCILGGNGSGKSTLAKHFNALLIRRRIGVHRRNGHCRRGKSVRNPLHGRHGVSNPAMINS